MAGGWQYPKRVGYRRRQGWLSRKRERDFVVIGATAAFIGLGYLGNSGVDAFMSAPAPRGDTQTSEHDGATIARPRVIDGDTIEDRATGERFRLENIDAAETHDRARCDSERRHGDDATDEARRLVSSAHVVGVRRTGRIDVYGRTIAFVTVDGDDLGRRLVNEGLARPWRGHREAWCGPNGELLP